MPKKIAPAERTARRARIAAKSVAGKTKSAIAREEGLSRNWIARELASPESRQIVATIVNHFLPTIAGMFESALDVLKEALKANLIANYKGEPVVLGPDHYARMVAVKRVTELLGAGRPPAKPASDAEFDETVTLEQLERLVGKKRPRPAVQ